MSKPAVDERTKGKTPVVIRYESDDFPVEDGKSVLETLEDANINIPFSCRNGVCHSCMLQAEGNIPIEAQKGLSASQIAQNYFLACSCYPKENLKVSPKGQTNLSTGIVTDKTLVNSTVLRLRLQVDFSWFPGQFVTLWKNEMTGRAYSIASRCDLEKTIELHIKHHEHGVVSGWLHKELQVGDKVSLSSASGECFYTDDHQQKPILMACTGTGLAPLYGILQEALAQQHNAPIYLYAASGDPSGLYYRDELSNFANTNTHFSYIPTVRRNTSEGADAGILQQDLLDLVKERHPDLKGYKVFICGAPDFVKALQRQCFFQGANVYDILVDAFELATPKI